MPSLMLISKRSWNRNRSKYTSLLNCKCYFYYYIQLKARQLGDTKFIKFRKLLFCFHSFTNFRVLTTYSAQAVIVHELIYYFFVHLMQPSSSTLNLTNPVNESLYMEPANDSISLNWPTDVYGNRIEVSVMMMSTLTV